MKRTRATEAYCTIEAMRRVFIFIGSVLFLIGLALGFVPMSSGEHGCGSFFVAAAPIAVPPPMPATVASTDDLAKYNADQELTYSMAALACSEARSSTLIFILPLGLLGFLILGSALVYRRPAARNPAI
ncbi:hypothetical protein GCM10009817_30780 [Terrabacter lapilli]|uniref:Secreted protein with PEP-CTERM sorting signal n=1 Tax=Terrabacter lapilli TaxID=436231 RepID=A0ABN2SJB5_9MICO